MTYTKIYEANVNNIKANKSHKHKSLLHLLKEYGNHYLVDQLSKLHEEEVATFIRENLDEFDHQEKILVATYRRLNSLNLFYSQEGCKLYLIREKNDNQLVACAGVGSLHGLPISESIGEIRDLIVSKKYRQQGLGKLLLKKCIEDAKNTGYKRLYLETSKEMIVAQKLFIRHGFRPVTQLPNTNTLNSELPSYFLLEAI